MDWIQILDRYGIPLTILILAVVGIIYGSKAVWRDLILPLRDGLLSKLNKFFDHLMVVLDKLLEHSSISTERAGNHQRITEEIREIVVRTNEQCQRIADFLDMPQTDLATRHQPDEPRIRR